MFDARAPHTLLAHDLYKDVHKAIRVELFAVTVAAGRLDPADQAARIAHAASVRDLVRFLVFHAEHEDDFLDAPIADVLADRAAQITADHKALEARMEDLVALADLAFEDDRDDDRAAVHDLYVELAAFTSAYLEHQNLEERVVMPALIAAYGVEAVLELEGRLLASIAPDDMAWALSKMLPAMNVDDRTELLVGTRLMAPPEAFAATCALAAEVLSPAEMDELAARLELSPAAH
jgi:hypothetical protein